MLAIKQPVVIGYYMRLQSQVNGKNVDFSTNIRNVYFYFHGTTRTRHFKAYVSTYFHSFRSIRTYWISGLYPLTDILNNRQNIVLGSP